MRTQLMVFALAATLAASGSKAKARTRASAPSAGGGRPPSKQTRRAQTDVRPAQRLPVIVSPCGRHQLRVADGRVMINGHRVHGPGENVFLLTRPVFRRDGLAVAWIERADGQIRLVVLPDVHTPASVLTWALPLASPDDAIAWTGPRRVHVGTASLTPRAVATWTES